MIKKILKVSLIVIFVIGFVVEGYKCYQSRKNIILVTNNLQKQLNVIQERYNRLIINDIDLFLLVKEIDRKINEPNIDKMLKSNVFVSDGEVMGAGTIIKKTGKHMYILTCHHVVESIIKINKSGLKINIIVGYLKIDENNKTVGQVIYGAELVKYNEEVDLALLKVFVIDNDLEVASIAEQEPKIGDVVYSVGAPLGLSRTISKGILSRKEEGVFFSDNTITFGNSGGGLYNIKGELIGVPNSVFVYSGGLDRSKKETYIPESGLGMSRDLQTIKKFLEGVDFNG